MYTLIFSTVKPIIPIVIHRIISQGCRLILIKMTKVVFKQKFKDSDPPPQILRRPNVSKGIS